MGAFGGTLRGGCPYQQAKIVNGGSYGAKDIDTETLSSFDEYESSISGRAKDDMVRKLARAMKKVGMNVNPDDDLDKIIHDLNKEIPNPKKGKTFAAEAKTQEKVCKIIAGVLNDEFTPSAPAHEKFIDLSMSPVEICRAVGEYTHSFNQGINTEFLGVIGSVKNTLHSMNLMDHVMTELYKKIQTNLNKADDHILERDIKPLHEMYTRAKHERDQKKMVLENLLHIHLEPASKALKEALHEHSKDTALIKKIGLKVGTNDFADSIASALTGLGSTAAIANKVHKALKIVGLSMKDYLNSRSFKEFQSKLDDIVEEGKMNDRDLVKFLSATKVLRDGFGHRNKKFEDIIATGGRGPNNRYKGGKRYNFSADMDDNLIDDTNEDVFETDTFGTPNKSSMKRRATYTKAKKEIINKDFVVRLDRHYSELLDAIKDIAKELGKSIPLTSKTDLLKDALNHLQETNDKSNEEVTLELAIIYGIDTIESRQQKEQYINKLKMIANVCDSITGMEAYRKSSSMFAKVKDIVNKIEKTMEYYSSMVNKNSNGMGNVGLYDQKYSKMINNPPSRHEHSRHEHSRHEKSRHEHSRQSNEDKDEDEDEVLGGERIEINTPQIAKTSLTLNEVINTYNYYYYLAGVRNNLKISTKEYDIFGDEYNNMLGNAIAKRLYELEVNYTIDVKQFLKDFTVSSGKFPNDKEVLKYKDIVRQWIDDEYNIKIKFYKALQALDLYLKEFTPAITANVDTVKEIKTMLDETQVIARWFNESTGNYIAAAFEELPGYAISVKNSGFFDKHPKDEKFKRVRYNMHPGTISFTDSDTNNIYNVRSENEHYYYQIYNQFTPNSSSKLDSVKMDHLGDPLFGRSYLDKDNIKNINNMKKYVDLGIDHFQALKNIVNTFIRIGNKFGSVDLSTKVFMSPSQIYKVLFNFLKQSSLRLHVPNTDKTIDKNTHDNDGTLNLKTTKQFSLLSRGAIDTGIKNSNGPNGKYNHTCSDYGYHIAPYSVYFPSFANRIGDMNENSKNNYEIENKFFHAIIKAMAGKIMTVVGAYDMLEMEPPKHWITNTRMILGGSVSKCNKCRGNCTCGGKRGGGKRGGEGPVAHDDKLEIIQGAMPLYFKLPRLIEFYKDILGFDKKAQSIAFLPDLDGIFTQLFLLIFRKTKSPENGDYSDSELHKLVEEINNIYNYYNKQHSHDITTAVMQDIVLDINRKYGLIKKDDYNTWVKMTKQQKMTENDVRINTTNYSILPDEDDFDIGTNAPSDIYQSLAPSVKFKDNFNEEGILQNPLTGKSYDPFSSETPNISDGGAESLLHKDLIREFRDKLDSYFSDSNIRNMSSYNILVHQAEHNVKHAKSNSEKIGIVFQLIQGTGNLGIKEDKAILFHETIIAGLNVLGGIEVLIRRYYENIKDINPYEIEKKLIDLMYLNDKKPYEPFKYNKNEFYITETNLFKKDYQKALRDKLNVDKTGYAEDIKGNRQRKMYEFNDANKTTYKIDADSFYSKEELPDEDAAYTDDNNNYTITADGYSRFIHSKYNNKKMHISDKEIQFLISSDYTSEPVFRGTPLLPKETKYYKNVITPIPTRLDAIKMSEDSISHVEDDKNGYDEIYGGDEDEPGIYELYYQVAQDKFNENSGVIENAGSPFAKIPIMVPNSHVTYDKVIGEADGLFDDTVFFINNDPRKKDIPYHYDDLFNGNDDGSMVSYFLPSELMEKNNKKLKQEVNRDGDISSVFIYDASIEDKEKHKRIKKLADYETLKDTSKLMLKARLVARCTVNYQQIMEYLLENIFSLVVDSNGLIDLSYVRIGNNEVKLSLNFVKLQNTVNGIIADLKYYLEYFRPFLKSHIIKKFEDRNQMGSIYFMEDQFHKLFNTQTDMYDDDIITNSYTAENISRLTSSIFTDLTRNTLVPLSPLSANTFDGASDYMGIKYFNDKFAEVEDSDPLLKSLNNDVPAKEKYSTAAAGSSWMTKIKAIVDNEMTICVSLKNVPKTGTRLVKLKDKADDDDPGTVKPNYYEVGVPRTDGSTASGPNLTDALTDSGYMISDLVKIYDKNILKDASSSLDEYKKLAMIMKFIDDISPSDLDSIIDDVYDGDDYKNDVTLYEWYGSTLSNLIFYDFSKKMPYNSPDKVWQKLYKLPAYNGNKDVIGDPTTPANNSKGAIGKTITGITNRKTASANDNCWYKYNVSLNPPVGGTIDKIPKDFRQFSIERGRLNPFNQLDTTTINPKNSAFDSGNFYVAGDTDGPFFFTYEPKSTTLVLFVRSAGSSYRLISNPFTIYKEGDFENMKNKDELKTELTTFLSGDSVVSGTNADAIITNLAKLLADGEWLYDTESLDAASFPKWPYSETSNYPYNMGVYNNVIEEPIRPSADKNYKLNTLMTKTQKNVRDNSGTSHLILDPAFMNLSSIAGNDFSKSSGEYVRSPLYSNSCTKNDRNSLMFIFNQLLSRFLMAFVDPSTGNKIYKNLINSFINGIASKVTSHPEYGFPDLYKAAEFKDVPLADSGGIIGHHSINGQNPGKLSSNSMILQRALGLRGDVKGDSIIFQSLAFILQRVGKDLDERSGNNRHLLNTLTDVPIYMKESYKANLPSFIKIFDFVIQKGEFFKNIIQKTNIKLNRYSQCDFANFINSCTGITDVRVNDVRYDLSGSKIRNKFYLGLPLDHKFINLYDNIVAIKADKMKNKNDNKHTPMSTFYKNLLVNNLNRYNPTENRTILDLCTKKEAYIELTNYAANGYFVPVHDILLDAIKWGRITKDDRVKISCTRGTVNYNLPIIKYNSSSNYFENLRYNNEFLKINDVNANSMNGYLAVDGIHEFTDKNESSDTCKSKLSTILDSIISHAYSLSTCADEVLKELGDSPIYFETFDNSIENYRAKNNNDQFMPLSLAMWFMNNNKSLTNIHITGPTHTLFGGHSLGTSDFKLLYGIRHLFARNNQLTYEDVPGVKTLLDHHNSSASDKQIDESRYLQFVNKLATGLRFIVNSHGYKRIVAFNSNGTNSEEEISTPDSTIWAMALNKNTSNNQEDEDEDNGDGIIQLVAYGRQNRDDRLPLQYDSTDIKFRNTVYALGNGNVNKELVLQVLEDSYQENSIEKILSTFYSEKIGRISRKQERIKVIIDSNINPINIHALMQDIPLANVYNYAYSFETMAASMYGLIMNKVSHRPQNQGHPLKRTVYEFLRLLRDPFADVDFNHFNNHHGKGDNVLFNIFMGDNSLGMGRPKFLSDQLFNKCLLSNVYFKSRRARSRGPISPEAYEGYTFDDSGDNKMFYDLFSGTATFQEMTTANGTSTALTKPVAKDTTDVNAQDLYINYPLQFIILSAIDDEASSDVYIEFIRYTINYAIDYIFPNADKAYLKDSGSGNNNYLFMPVDDLRSKNITAYNAIMGDVDNIINYIERSIDNNISAWARNEFRNIKAKDGYNELIIFFKATILHLLNCADGNIKKDVNFDSSKSNDFCSNQVAIIKTTIAKYKEEFKKIESYNLDVVLHNIFNKSDELEPDLSGPGPGPGPTGTGIGKTPPGKTSPGKTPTDDTSTDDVPLPPTDEVPLPDKTLTDVLPLSKKEQLKKRAAALGIVSNIRVAALLKAKINKLRALNDTNSFLKYDDELKDFSNDKFKELQAKVNNFTKEIAENDKQIKTNENTISSSGDDDGTLGVENTTLNEKNASINESITNLIANFNKIYILDNPDQLDSLKLNDGIITADNKKKLEGIIFKNIARNEDYDKAFEIEGDGIKLLNDSPLTNSMQNLNNILEESFNEYDTNVTNPEYFVYGGVRTPISEIIKNIITRDKLTTIDQIYQKIENKNLILSDDFYKKMYNRIVKEFLKIPKIAEDDKFFKIIDKPLQELITKSLILTKLIENENLKLEVDSDILSSLRTIFINANIIKKEDVVSGIGQNAKRNYMNEKGNLENNYKSDELYLKTKSIISTFISSVLSNIDIFQAKYKETSTGKDFYRFLPSKDDIWKKNADGTGFDKISVDGKEVNAFGEYQKRIFDENGDAVRDGKGALQSEKGNYDDSDLYGRSRESHEKYDDDMDEITLIMSYIKEYDFLDRNGNPKGLEDDGEFKYADDADEDDIEAYDKTINETNNEPLKSFVYEEGVPSIRRVMSHLGYTRFNTNMVRNLFFISNILRIVRLQINREFTQNRNILKSSHFAISPSVTEYGISTMDPNEISSTRYRNFGQYKDEFYGEVEDE